MHEVVLTFPTALRYKCDIETCKGCCSIFEEIEIGEGDVKSLEKLGYASFYVTQEGRLLLKKPCPFSKGRLCEIHMRHGYAAKPDACKKYPFAVSVLDNGWVVVDVKWSCPGVGADDGEPLTAKYIERKLLSYMDRGRINRVSLEDYMPLVDGGEIRITRSGVRELYEYVSKNILFSALGVREKIMGLTSLIKQFSQACEGKKTVARERVSEILRSLEWKEDRVEAALQEQGLGYYGLIDDFLSFELNPLVVAKKLGIDYKLTSPTDAGFSKDAGELYSLYLSQCLMETLSKPWSVRASFFWALGVLGYVDFVSRSIAEDEVRKTEIRAAIAVVDFLNKGLEDFRKYAYPRYPELGFSYLDLLLGN
jgi:Fe-S-cluster containining protein